jgi:hypothetical protein
VSHAGKGGLQGRGQWAWVDAGKDINTTYAGKGEVHLC